jgi:hypothetical protein
LVVLHVTVIEAGEPPMVRRAMKTTRSGDDAKSLPTFAMVVHVPPKLSLIEGEPGMPDVRRPVNQAIRVEFAAGVKLAVVAPVVLALTVALEVGVPRATTYPARKRAPAGASPCRGRISVKRCG